MMAHQRQPSHFVGGQPPPQQHLGYSMQAPPPHASPHGPHGPHGGPHGAKRSRPGEEEMGMGLHDGGGGMHGLPQPGMGYGQPQPLLEHHHTLPPGSGHQSKRTRLEESFDEQSHSAPSVVGQVGMPAPAPRPRGPKLKFTPEDDGLLVDLKENKSLTWKQIAEFFPGRSSGTLQVRYCTKLKAKTTQWTDETVQKLRTALQDYEQEKWRIVANKVGTGFTPAACRDKALEL